jgi:thioredoxin reductase (NADPH)
MFRSSAATKAVMKGHATEDDSAGFTLTNDPKARSAQWAIRDYALRNQTLILQVLTSSSEAHHRALAARMLGYGPQSGEQIDVLVHASLDADNGVRNDAVRALDVLAGAKPDLARRIPPEAFIRLLRSGAWSDHNKASLLLVALTSRDPNVLTLLRTEALDSLVEMARWRNPGHAGAALAILGRIAGIDEDSLNKLIDSAWKLTCRTRYSGPKSLPGMKKPYIIAIDDDLAVLRAVERDLKVKFSSQYRVLAADSPQKAIGIVRQLTSRGDRIALFLVDQRMPFMSGTEFLQEATVLQPEARRVLLTAYADSAAAIDAINKIKLNHYLMKPWEPPEQHLYPVLIDQLEDWQAGNREAFEGAFIIGTRWAPETHRLKDFLARSQVPYRWLEPEGITEARVLAALGGVSPAQPVVILPDGSVLERPEISQLAERLGLSMIPKGGFYDVIVIGAGPAGLACALYCSTEGLRTVLIEREAAGGQAGLSSRIENYLGFPSGLSGADLTRRAVTQVRRFGTEVLAPAEAVSLMVDGEYRIVKLSNGQELVAHSVVIASGVQWRRLDVPGMEQLSGAGIYYGAAITEASSCKDEDIYIVGAANSAGQAAVHFSEVARSVKMIVRGNSLSKSMSQYLVERIRSIPNISVIPNSEVIEVRGQTRLEEIIVRHHDTQLTQELPAAALFIFIGAEPHTQWLDGVVCRDGKGFLVTGANLLQNGKRPAGWNLDRDPHLLETNVPGVFAIGDVRDGAVRRVANSVGEGSIVPYFIHQYMQNR